jgi:hypothetical protein
MPIQHSEYSDRLGAGWPGFDSWQEQETLDTTDNYFICDIRVFNDATSNSNNITLNSRMNSELEGICMEAVVAISLNTD